MPKKILVLNGPNLNLLGRREPEIYGRATYADLEREIHAAAARWRLTATVKQSNHEGVLVDWIQAADGKFAGIVINPAAYTHTSVAILDALKAVALPAVEVHLSAIETREKFRRHSYISPACLATITGHGFAGYGEALALLAAQLVTH
ncbi:MAG: type II 3-dehydroquinate dehydratase [Planctomycetota bacterium]|jgi:3-dehydroquinate dehydratase-2|nr:type II 3-dehydroquinate dehydratase [Planctomycetota bacterium]